MRKSGTIAPVAAPTTLARYRKLNELGDSFRKLFLIDSIAKGMVAPMQAHHGTKVRAIQMPDPR